MDIYFRALEIKDAIPINKMRTIKEYEELIIGPKRFVSIEREKKWVEDLIMRDYQDRNYVAICEKETNEFIGYTSVSDIDYRNNKCFWSGIKILPEFAGKGYGTQAALLILKYIFEELGIERCIAMCIEDHIAAKKMMEKVGFIIEGLMRHFVFKNGEYQNVFLLSVLSSDYLKIKEKYQL